LEPVSQEGRYRENEEHDKEDLRYSHEGACDPAKAKDCSDQSDDKASDCQL
jgi:hypothetical protein